MLVIRVQHHSCATAQAINHFAHAFANMKNTLVKTFFGNNYKKNLIYTLLNKKEELTDLISNKGD